MAIEIKQGDCLDVLMGLPSNSIDCVITDPPYDFDNDMKVKIHNELVRVSKGWVIVFCPPENQWIHPADQYLFWVKPISTKNTSKRYSRFIEMILVYNNGHWDPKRHWSQYTNVFTDVVNFHLHPHSKPVATLERLVLNHTRPNEVVLDCFMGSGSTGIACQNTGRSFIGIELDPTYFQVAKERLGI